MPVLEKDIEAKVVKYAKAQECLSRKMNGFGFNGWPDRLFILPNGKTFWIEFKRPGNVLSPGQEELISQLRQLKHVVYVCNDAEKGKAIIDAELSRKV